MRIPLLILALWVTGCAEQPPKLPFLNKAGEQAKRTGTLFVTGERSLVHQFIPIDASASTSGLDVKFCEFIFNPPITTSTSILTYQSR